MGKNHIFQAIILYFVKVYPDLIDQAPWFCQILYESDFLTDEFFVDWYNKRTAEGWVSPLDINSCLNDIEAEQIMH